MKELWRGCGTGVWAGAVEYWAELFDAMSDIEYVRQHPLDMGIILVPADQEERIDPVIRGWLARRNFMIMTWDTDPRADGEKMLADFEARRLEGVENLHKFVAQQQKGQACCPP